RIAQPVEALLVEGGGSERVLAPISRHDIGPAQPRFELALAWDELELDPWHRQAHIGRVLALPRARNGHVSALGGPEPGQEHDALAAGLKRQLLHLVEYRLRKRRAGKPEDLEIAKEGLAQPRIGAEIRQQRLVALRYREIPVCCHLAQVFHRGLDM